MTNNPHTLKQFRTRMAPSPTGNLHIGTARATLFNYLAAHHYGGAFIMRLEDTDTERSTQVFEKNIIDGLHWLGLTWDEGPFRQSERLDLYKQKLQELLASGKAFYCTHSKEYLEQEKNEQISRKESPHHRCEDRDTHATTGIIRIKNDETGILTFHDIIRGDISFKADDLGDFSLARNLDSPLYNFAVVIDDEDMKISHVIRGEDHIPNTPKHIIIQRAFGYTPPIYAHLPLVLGPDRSKLSKRHGATSIDEYRKEGYLPAAILNFIALLGWHTTGDKEHFTLEELIKDFTLERIQKSGAVFDIEKLNWLNGIFIRELSPRALADKIIPYLIEAGFITQSGSSMVGKNGDTISSKYIEKVAILEQPRLKKLSEIVERVDYFFSDPKYDPELLRWKGTQDFLSIHDNLTNVKAIMDGLSESDFTAELLKLHLMPYADDKGRGDVLWPLRVSLSGKKASPDPFDVMSVLGKTSSLKRIETGISLLAHNQ